MPSLKQLIDLDTLQNLLERFYQITGFRAGLVDTQGTILISTGAPEICMEFHRQNPVTAKRCLLSDLHVCRDQCQPKGYFTYKCANGLMHCGVPVVIQEQQLGTFFLGSFLFEEPDVEMFRAQAKILGFDVQAYLAALEDVPVFTPDQVDQAMDFYIQLVNWMALVGFQNVQLLKATASLDDLQERYALALSGGREGVWDWDLKNETVYFSPRWKEILGFADHDLPNDIHSWRSLIHPDDFQKVMKANMSLFTPGVDHFSVQYRMRHKNGSYLWILGRGTCIRDASGLPIRLTGTHTDITPHKEAEKELRQQKHMEAISTLAGGVAHEFNNILQGISGNTQLVQSCLPSDGREQKYLRQTIDAVGRASELINDLLTFSQQVRISSQGVDLNAIVRQTVETLRPIFADRLSLEINLDPELDNLPGDPGQLEQILHLLIQNAEDAIPKDKSGSVRITTQMRQVAPSCQAGMSGLTPGIYAELCIADNGCGMDQHHRQQIFNPFFTTKDPGKGTGLGLSTVYNVVKAHKGMITCSSTPDQGTEFSILLPVLAPGGTDRESGTTSISSADSGQPGSQLNVLVVDDDELVLETVSEALQWVDMSVVKARSGQEMLQQCRQHDQVIDALICDLELCTETEPNWLKAVLEEFPSMPVVVTSGHPAPDSSSALQGCTIASFVSKPFKHEKLLSELHAVIGSQLCR